MTVCAGTTFRKMVKLATLLRGSDSGNFRGFRFRGSVVVSYTTVSVP
jgi:hypothetical protein